MFTDLWNKAASDSYCPNMLPSNVTQQMVANTQKDCQVLCEAKSESECVGISYSKYIGSANICILCMDDTLISANNVLDFYRRPGMFRIFLWLINRNLYI